LTGLRVDVGETKEANQMIEMTMIPMLEHEISSVEGRIDQLTEEIGTD
jgi:hypothetical protein